MTLEDKIQKEAKKVGQLAPMFITGANFALKNLWINVFDDMPYNHKELILEDGKHTEHVLIWTNKGLKFDRMVKTPYGKDGWMWDSESISRYAYVVTHWMPIPKLSEKEYHEVICKSFKFK